MMLDWMMANGYGKLKDEVRQLEEWRHRTLEPANRRPEPCAEVIVSAAARRSISVGGSPPVQKGGCGCVSTRVGGQKHFFSGSPKNFVLSSKFSSSHSFIHYRHFQNPSLRGATQRRSQPKHDQMKPP